MCAVYKSKPVGTSITSKKPAGKFYQLNIQFRYKQYSQIHKYFDLNHLDL